MKKNNLLKYLSCGVFASLYLLVAVISLICSTEFFALAHGGVMSWVLAIGFEVGAMSCLLSTLILPREKQALVWIMFVILTLFQCMSNTYMAYAHLENFSGWVELFGLNELEPIAQKRILASISGAILPLVALGFIRIMANVLQNNDSAKGLPEPEAEPVADAATEQGQEPADETDAPAELEPDEYGDEVAEISESWNEEPVEVGEPEAVEPAETEEEPVEAEPEAEVENDPPVEEEPEAAEPETEEEPVEAEPEAEPEPEKPADEPTKEPERKQVEDQQAIGTAAPNIPKRMWNPSTNKYM